MSNPTEAAPEGFMHAWYSAKNDNVSGTATYKGVSGERVEVTEVSASDVPCSKWDDLEYVGLIMKGCVGVSRRASHWR